MKLLILKSPVGSHNLAYMAGEEVEGLSQAICEDLIDQGFAKAIESKIESPETNKVVVTEKKIVKTK
jgi:hypothetical protein